MAKQKLIKHACEICGDNNKKILHLHHIIERTEANTNNHPFNLAIICPNCHSLVHDGSIRIIGIYPSTEPPNGRTLVFEKNGTKNIDLDEPYVKFENKGIILR